MYTSKCITTNQKREFSWETQTSLQNPGWDYTRVYEVCGLTEKKKKKKNLLGFWKIVSLQKKKLIFLHRFFVLFSSQNIKKFLNQDGFSRTSKIIVLFSEKKESK